MRRRLTERDLSRITRRVINEMDYEDYDDRQTDDQQTDDQQTGFTPRMGGDIIRVRDFAYEMITEMAPDGPRNKRQYMSAINQLEKDFNYIIRNLKGNIGM